SGGKARFLRVSVVPGSVGRRGRRCATSADIVFRSDSVGVCVGRRYIGGIVNVGERSASSAKRLVNLDVGCKDGLACTVCEFSNRAAQIRGEGPAIIGLGKACPNEPIAAVDAVTCYTRRAEGKRGPLISVLVARTGVERDCRTNHR